jgi:phytanoyl-CoA hydroxylase
MQRQLQLIVESGYFYDQCERPELGVHLQLHELSECSRLFRSLPWAPQCVNAVDKLIGPAPAVVHLDQSFVKPPRVGLGTAAHQDNHYFRVSDPLEGVALWIAVDDATTDNGTMRLYPGTHRSPTLPHTRDGYSNHLMSCAASLEDKVGVPCCTKAGGVVFFCYGVAHTTHRNESDVSRAGVAYHFLSATKTNMASFGHASTWQSRLLTGPDCDGGMVRYGVDLRGSWLGEVGAALAGQELTPSDKFLEHQQRQHTRAEAARRPSL